METTGLQTEITAEIRNANDTFEKVFGQGDAAGLADLYTHSGMLLPSGSEIVQGKEGIQEFWQGAMNMGVKQIKLDTIDIELLETTAIEIGRSTLSGEDGQEMDNGKYMVVWKNENGNWKIQKDIWNSSLIPG